MRTRTRTVERLIREWERSSSPIDFVGTLTERERQKLYKAAAIALHVPLLAACGIVRDGWREMQREAEERRSQQLEVPTPERVRVKRSARRAVVTP